MRSDEKMSLPTRRWPLFPKKQNPNKRLANPFSGKSYDQMETIISKFLKEVDLDLEDRHIIRKGAFLAQDEEAFEHDRKDGLKLTYREEEALNREKKNKFDQPFMLYAVIACCSLCAATQGMDESVINQAQLLFQHYFCQLQHDSLLLGLVNSSPYLSAAVIGVWLTDPVNSIFGRRGALFFACAISCTACIWQAFTYSIAQMIVARLFLGIGIGLKSTTAPIYAAECAPKNIRGGLVMFWQMWTAFGIMLGYISGVIFAGISSINPNIDTCSTSGKTKESTTIGWRLMMGSPMILPFIVCVYVYFLPESPRWLLKKAPDGRRNNYQKAFTALCQLRATKLQAARDLMVIYHRLKQEGRLEQHRNRFVELFSVGRNRRALFASVLVMFFQQFCGVNVLAYYSSTVFYSGAGWSIKKSFQVSMGFGMLNFIFAIPAVFLIDTLGRRRLLLCTFPFLAIFHFFSALALKFLSGEALKVCVTLSMYLFDVAYSLGEGPVPFVYSAESMPLYVRELGMSVATCTNWIFTWCLGMTFPYFWDTLGHMGTFLYYSVWCLIGLFLIIPFVPETRGLSLEELDLLFSISTKRHIAHGWSEAKWLFNGIFRLDFANKPELDLEPDVNLNSRLRNMRKVAFNRPDSKLYSTVSQEVDEWDD